MYLRKTCLLLCTLLAIQASAQRRQPVSVAVPGGALSGTLTLPAASGRPPVVLLVPTSGPIDRDGNSEMMVNNTLRDLSDSLAARGIATLRYDKRGVGGSKRLSDETRLKFGDYASDVTAIMKWLKSQNRFSRIVLAGQGEGALIGMISARQSRPDAFIGINGPGERIDSLLLRQLLSQGLKPGALDTARMLLAELNTTGTIAKVPSGPFYGSMFRPSVQRYLSSWIRFDPRIEIKNLRCPVLLIQGDNDLQMDTMQLHYLAAAVPDAATLIIPGMNHIFRQAPREMPANMATYFESGLGIESVLVQRIAAFVTEK